ncbi:MAG: hypothetical protein JRJ84_20320 [Deltaproteobacteria bacterium]|nr:hypothetical protein [Deltaproteobacteria bacterium]
MGRDPQTVRCAYFVHHRMPGWVDEAAYTLDPGDQITVREVDFFTMAYEDTAARGDLERQVRRATTPRLNLQAVLGVRTFGTNTIFNHEYIPAHVVAGAQLRFLPHRKGPFWSVDLVTGTGSATLAFDLVGDQDVQVRSYSAGANAGWATGRGIVRAGGGGRVELVHFARDFQDVSLDRQSATSVAPGLAGWVGIHYGRFNVDYTQSLLILPVRWDDNPAPLFSELALTVGYRF